MDEPLPPPNPVLVRSTRNGVVECRHRGVVCVVDRAGAVVFSRGDVRQVSFTRSSLKFLQALALIASGGADRFGMGDEEIAVMCASHNGEPAHLAAARSVLAKAGVPESALGCGPHPPAHAPSAEVLVRAGVTPTDIHNNCSGKHAGFLALARHLDAPLDGYLDPDHPAQRRIRATVCRMAELRESALRVGVDGCSAPNYAMPVLHMAIAFRNLVTGVPDEPALDAACRRVVRAVTAHPFLVGGTGRYCTVLMQAGGGRIVGKAGAEGYYASGVIDRGLGLAVKIDDGTGWAAYTAIQAALERVGAFRDGEAGPLQGFLRAPIKNCKGRTVGERGPEDAAWA